MPGVERHNDHTCSWNADVGFHVAVEFGCPNRHTVAKLSAFGLKKSCQPLASLAELRVRDFNVLANESGRVGRNLQRALERV